MYQKFLPNGSAGLQGLTNSMEKNLTTHTDSGAQTVGRTAYIPSLDDAVVIGHKLYLD